MGSLRLGFTGARAVGGLRWEPLYFAGEGPAQKQTAPYNKATLKRRGGVREERNYCHCINDGGGVGHCLGQPAAPAVFHDWLSGFQTRNEEFIKGWVIIIARVGFYRE